MKYKTQLLKIENAKNPVEDFEIKRSKLEELTFNGEISSFPTQIALSSLKQLLCEPEKEGEVFLLLYLNEKERDCIVSEKCLQHKVVHGDEIFNKYTTGLEHVRKFIVNGGLTVRFF